MLAREALYWKSSFSSPGSFIFNTPHEGNEETLSHYPCPARPCCVVTEDLKIRAAFPRPTSTLGKSVALLCGCGSGVCQGVVVAP